MAGILTTGFTSMLIGETNGDITTTAQPTLVGGVPVSSVLELQSVLGGLLMSRMTAVQATALDAIVDGMMIYVTTIGGAFAAVGLYLRTGGAWVVLNTAGGVSPAPDDAYYVVTQPSLVLTNEYLAQIEDGTLAASNTRLGSGVLAAMAPLTAAANNSGFGFNALNSLTTGTQNTAIGSLTLASVTASSNNTAVGYTALRLNTGLNNTAVGSGALTANTTGSSNTAVGVLAANANTTGISCVAIGFNALLNNVGGSDNVAVGVGALQANVGSSGSCAIGAGALQNNTAASNTAVGTNALNSNTIGASNIAIGVSSAAGNLSGRNNISIGNDALLSNTTGSSNIAIGSAALSLNTASNNTAVGDTALEDNTAGTQNVSVGYNSLNSNTTGNDNVAVGANALAANTVSTGSCAIGTNALLVSTGPQNTAVGTASLGANIAGSSNSTFGYNSGILINAGNSNTFIGATAGAAQLSYSLCTFLGDGADASVNALTNATAIGSAASISVPNAMVLGNNIVGVGIGTSAPTSGLHLGAVGGNFNPSIYISTGNAPATPAVGDAAIAVAGGQLKVFVNSANPNGQGTILTGFAATTPDPTVPVAPGSTIVVSPSNASSGRIQISATGPSPKAVTLKGFMNLTANSRIFLTVSYGTGSSTDALGCWYDSLALTAAGPPDFGVIRFWAAGVNNVAIWVIDWLIINP